MEKRISLLNSGSRYLAREGIESARCESELFLSHILDCPRAELYLNNITVKEDSLQQFWQFLTTRAESIPLQYILGSTEFMGLRFKVRPGVFIPRPETEILVEAILHETRNTKHETRNILDMGTGCGNIAVSLAKYLAQVHVFACDICDSALQLAEENSRLNKVDVHLLKSDFFCAFKKGKCFSLIASNPPYISSEQIPELPRELHHEPKAALDGGADGLFYCRRIIKEAADYLQDKGILALEIGDNQACAVKELFMQSARFSLISVVKDYNGVERVIVARKEK